MKKHNPMKMKLGIALCVLAAFAVTFGIVRRPLANLVNIHAHLLFSESRNYATANDREKWLMENPGVIRVAMIGEWSSTAIHGPERKQAFEKAISEINAAGIIKGRKIEAKWVDSNEDGDRLQTVTTLMANDPSIYAVFTCLATDPLLSIKPLLIQGRILAFAPGVCNSRVYRLGERPYIFMPNPSDADVADGVGAWLSSKADRMLLTCYSDTEESRGLAEEMQKSFQYWGIMTYFRRSFSLTQNPRGAKMVLSRSQKEYGMQNLAVPNEEFGKEIYPHIVRWFLDNMTGQIFLSHPVAGDWSDEEKKRIVLPVRPTQVELSYRSMYIFADALRQSESLDPDDVTKTLLSKELKTPSGPFRFTPEHFELTERVVVKAMK